MQHISKRFGNLTANHDVSLRIRPGEIHALVGENGAGKSTLMRILCGFYAPDAGRILIDGHDVQIGTTSDAISLGIGMVHQHFMLIPPLTVTENIILGMEETGRFGLLDLPRAAGRLLGLSAKYRLNVDPLARVEQLSIGFQQRIEILKILFREARIIILDEPTPILTPQEIEDLFQILLQLKNEGKTIILITHKLSEVMAISDSVTVMRHGTIAGERETPHTTQAELARLMIGEDIGPPAGKLSSPEQGREVLAVRDVSAASDRGVPALRGVSFSVREGEILGIAGVEGNGQSELVQVIAGLRPVTTGEILIAPAPGGESARSRSGAQRPALLAHIPEDRLRHGLILDFTLQENLILGRQRELAFSRHAFRRIPAIRAHARTLIDAFDIRPRGSPLLPARSLSGGNQQKAVVARELSKHSLFILASQPTRGLDIRAIDFIHNSLIRERNSGKAILLVSSDLAEILKLSDRVAVMYEGRIARICHASETDERELGLYMTGARKSA